MRQFHAGERRPRRALTCIASVPRQAERNADVATVRRRRLRPRGRSGHDRGPGRPEPTELGRPRAAPGRRGRRERSEPGHPFLHRNVFNRLRSWATRTRSLIDAGSVANAAGSLVFAKTGELALAFKSGFRFPSGRQPRRPPPPAAPSAHPADARAQRQQLPPRSQPAAQRFLDALREHRLVLRRLSDRYVALHGGSCFGRLPIMLPPTADGPERPSSPQSSTRPGATARRE